MKKKSKHTLTPKLRFPEFRDTPGWMRTPLAGLFSERQEKGDIDLSLLSLTDKEGIIPQEESNRKNNSNQDKSKYLKVVPGDVAYNTMRMWEGRSAYVGLEGLVSPAYTVCKPKQNTNGLFFSYYFKTAVMIEQFRRFSQGLVKDTLNLKFKAFARIASGFPSLPEQQKIADCLSSLDGWIAAEGRKLEALKAHKKGLMQQLFPQPGETQPRLRFPEFRGQWIEGQLSQLANPISDRVGTMPCIPYTVTSGQGLVSQEDKFGRTIAGNSLRNYIRLQKDDFAYNKSATKAYPEGYITRYLDEAKAAVPNSIFMCFRVDSEKVDPAYLDFLFAANLHGRWLRKFLTIGARTHGTLNVSNDDLMALPVPLPSPPEQQKIADCLTSLDIQITAQAEKKETLKQHKRGLMQQLFPSPEEADA